MFSTRTRDRLDHTPVDVLNLNELADRCMGNLEFAERMLERFQGLLDGELNEVKQAASANDMQLVGQIAHRIKGAAASVAAHALVKVASEIEVAARDVDAETVWSRLPVLSAERDRLKRSAPRFEIPDSGTA